MWQSLSSIRDAPVVEVVMLVLIILMVALFVSVVAFLVEPHIRTSNEVSYNKRTMKKKLLSYLQTCLMTFRKKLLTGSNRQL